MQKKKKILIFTIKFFVLFSVFHYILLLLNIGFFQEAITSFQANLLGLEFDGIKIFVNDAIFVIVASCTGLVSAIILGSIIFSLRKPSIPEKIGVFLAGFILLMIVNQFRLFIVLWSGVLYGVQVAEIVHIISWFATTIAIIFAWYYFTKKLTKSVDFEGFL